MEKVLKEIWLEVQVLHCTGLNSICQQQASTDGGRRQAVHLMGGFRRGTVKNIKIWTEVDRWTDGRKAFVRRGLVSRIRLFQATFGVAGLATSRGLYFFFFQIFWKVTIEQMFFLSPYLTHCLSISFLMQNDVIITFNSLKRNLLLWVIIYDKKNNRTKVFLNFLVVNFDFFNWFQRLLNDHLYYLE